MPPPMSISATPISFSSSLSTAWALASGSRTISATWRSQRCAHFVMFWAAELAAVTRWTRASRRTPLMPTGSRMPSWSSTMNSCGSTWMTWRSPGSGMALACSRTRLTSSSETSRVVIAATPSWFIPVTWLPAIPA